VEQLDVEGVDLQSEGGGAVMTGRKKAKGPERALRLVVKP
jgi:hypothetical protein